MDDPKFGECSHSGYKAELDSESFAICANCKRRYSLKEKPKFGEWVAVENGNPGDDSEVLVYAIKAKGLRRLNEIRLAYFKDGRFNVYDYGDYDYDLPDGKDVRYWMLLPPAPPQQSGQSTYKEVITTWTFDAPTRKDLVMEEDKTQDIKEWILKQVEGLAINVVADGGDMVALVSLEELEKLLGEPLPQSLQSQSAPSNPDEKESDPQ